MPDPVGDLLEELRSVGIRLEVEGPDLRVQAPAGTLTTALTDRIRGAKSGILDRLRAERAEASRARGPGPHPLGLVQRWLWIQEQLEGGSSINSLPGAWRLLGRLEHKAFEEAFREVVRRHRILRARILWDGGEPQQVLDGSLEVAVPVVDLRSFPLEERRKRMMRRIEELRDRPFEVGRAPLFRVRLFRLAEGEHVFFLVAHHLIWDGWSWDVLHEELSGLYPAFRDGRPSPLPELPVDYLEYVLRHRERMEGPELERHLAYWRRELSDPPRVLDLPYDHPPAPGERTLTGVRRALDLDAELLGRARALAAESRTTLFMVLLAAYAAWLHRWTGQHDFLVGAPTQDRLEAGSERLIGALVNTMALRIRLTPGATFRELLDHVRDVCVAAYDHQDVPFDRVVAEVLGGRRPEGGAPFLSSLFTFQEVSNRPATIGDLEVRQVHVDMGVAPTDVLLGVMVGAREAIALMDFNAQAFEPATVDRMAASFLSVLRDALDDPGLATERLRLATPASVRTSSDLEDLFDRDARAEEKDGAPDGTGRWEDVTPLQEEMWFVERALPGTSLNHRMASVRVSEAPEPGRLERAAVALSERYPVLRSVFGERDGRLRVRRLERIRPELVVQATAEEGEVQRTLAVLAAEPFDLERGPLLRVALLPHEGRGATVAVVTHGLVADRRSARTLLRDLSAAYSGTDVEETPAPPGYDAVVGRWMDWLESDEARQAAAWWTDYLTPLPEPLDLPTDFPRPTSLSLASHREVRALPEGIVARARALAVDARPGGVEQVVLTALFALLARLSGQDEVAVGVLVRPGPDDEGRAVGCLDNRVVVRVSPRSDDSFRTLFGRVSAEMEAARQRARYPFGRVVEESRPPRSVNRHPLVQVGFSSDSALDAMDFGGEIAVEIPTREGTQLLDLAVHTTGGAAGACRVEVEGAADLFSVETVAEMAARVDAAVSALVAEPDRPLGEVDLLPPEERNLLLVTLNDTRAPVAAPTVVHRLAEVVAERPEDVAVTQDQVALSYGRLWARSGTVATALRERGVEAGDVVGVSLPRSPDTLVALLGIWRAGAAYLPLDIDFPDSRVRFMVQDAGCRIVVAGGAETVEFPAHTIALGALEEEGDVSIDHPPPDPATLAYVRYTSGSTGRPKGVEIEHGALANFLTSMARRPGLRGNDVVLATTTLSFDISELELWLALWQGARLEIAPEDDAWDGDALRSRLVASGATVLQATPATWRILVESGWEGPLRLALCGGEAFPPELVDPLLRGAGEVWNLYGPTETTIWSTAHRVTRQQDEPVPIGRPIDNTEVFIMDARGRLLPRGSEGELWIGGRGLARGYRGRPELTDEAFVPHPYRNGARLYRTGDLARWRHDGLLEHRGRLDSQVKVNGYRIELGEVETVLARHEAVRQAVVTVSEGGAGGARLVAFFVPRDGARVVGSELRRFLRHHLPRYMVPGLISEIDEVPLTPNGKVDRRSLPDLLTPTVTRRFEEPAGEVEAAIADVWSDLLEVERVGRNDNFFELGGHSLLAIRAASLLEERLGWRINPRSFFFYTLSGLADSRPGSHAPTESSPARP